jgi:hypothetical protein
MKMIAISFRPQQNEEFIVVAGKQPGILAASGQAIPASES